jgi:small conductance mechanosensitive channel
MNDLRLALSDWLDPQLIGSLVLAWSGRVLGAIAIFFIGRMIAKALAAGFGRAVQRAGMDQTFTRFFGSLIYIALIVMVALTAVAALGVPTTNFLAILGAAGLAVGLALKDSLSNFSSGVMLVFFRPFKFGDYIEAAGVAGKVETIGIFNTIVKTLDNRVITIPNSLVYAGTITNFSAEATRRVDLMIGVSYADDLVIAKRLIAEVLAAETRVLKEPAPVIVIDSLGDSSVNIAVRPWVARDDFLLTRGALLEDIKQKLEANGLSIPFPQRDVHIVTQTAGK